MLIQQALSQTFGLNQKSPVIEKVDESSDEFEFSSQGSTYSSKPRDTPHSVSTTVMLVMMTNTTSLEVQVSIITNEVHDRKWSHKRCTNSFHDEQH
jgi:hypothetical protein